MSEQKKVDVTETIIYHEDTATLPPPRLEVGALAWLRQNLLGSPLDIVITIVSFLILLTLVISFFDWSIRSANWYSVINNQRLFMFDRLEPQFEWRVALTVLLAALLTGVSFAVWARRSMRNLALITIAIVAVIVFLPSVIEATISQPESYVTAGNVDIIDRASTLLPQSNLGFIAQAGETVEVRMTNTEVEDLGKLKDLSGFSDRVTNTLGNSAQNRIDQQAAIEEIFSGMISREFTENLEERNRVQIDTFARTTDIVASTVEFATRTRDQFIAGDLNQTQLEVWLSRLDAANSSLDESDASVDEAIAATEGIFDTLDTTLNNELGNLVAAQTGDTNAFDETLILRSEDTTILSVEEWLAGLKAQVDTIDDPNAEVTAAYDAIEAAVATFVTDIEPALDELVAALSESELTEDIGEAVIIGITEDLIGLEDQPDAQESLLRPTPVEADFLRDMFVTLLTPQSVINTYNLNQTAIQVQILDADTMDVLSEGVVTTDGGEVVSLQIPTDGWYILSKQPLEGEAGTAVLAVNGIFPIVERGLGANRSEFVRLTDNELTVTDPRPSIDGEDIPFVVLVDNQFRGLRDLSAYLIHFVPLFFAQVDLLLTPLILAVAWGFVLGRVLAHLLGAETHFSNLPSRLWVVVIGLMPLGVMLIYFGLIAGDFGITPITGIVGAIIKLVLVVGSIFLAGQIDSWLNRLNNGEDAEANITSKLIYSWGIFPVLMYVFASGIGGFSGATLGSAIGGLVWLMVMYFVGINFKGLLGYGLLVGGLFMQFAQAFIVQSAWSAGTWHEGDVTHIAFWLVVAAAGVAVAYVGSQMSNSRNIMILRGGLIIGLVLWLGAMILTPTTIDGLRGDESTVDVVQGFIDNELFPAELVSDLRIQTPIDAFNNMSAMIADENVDDGMRSFFAFQQDQEVQAKTLNRVMAIAGWLLLMFIIGQANLTTNMLFVGLAAMTFHWYLWVVQIDIWSTIYFIAWLAVGMVLFNRGVEAGRDGRKEVTNGEGSFTQRFALPGLLVSAGAWLVVLFLIPQAVIGLESAGILTTSPNDLLPLSDKRAWGGLMLTMQLTILGIGASFPIGLALALGRRSNLPVVKTACILYIEAVRGVPLITVLFLATLLVPLVEPSLATVEGAVRVWVGVTMFSAAYLAENVRGGLQSIPIGQTEAAQAIGLSQWQTTISILLPQALRAVIPALVGQFISLFKDTSLVVIVGLAEITGIANRVVQQPEFFQKRQEVYLYIAIIYFVFSYIMSYISRRVEETGSGAARAQQI